MTERVNDGEPSEAAWAHFGQLAVLAEDGLRHAEQWAEAAEHGPGSALRALRELADLSIEQTAALADTTPRYLGKVEAGVLLPSGEYAARISRVVADRLISAAKRQEGGSR